MKDFEEKRGIISIFIFTESLNIILTLRAFCHLALEFDATKCKDNFKYLFRRFTILLNL